MATPALFDDFPARIDGLAQTSLQLAAQTDSSFNPLQIESLNQIHQCLLRFRQRLDDHAQHPYSLHDLRSPLATAVSFTNLLIAEIDGALDPDQREKLRQLNTDTRYLLDRAGDLLA